MSRTSTLEVRLRTVEKQISEVLEHLARPSSAQPWYQPMIGSMKDFPEFEQVVKLGRKIRKSNHALRTRASETD